MLGNEPAGTKRTHTVYTYAGHKIEMELESVGEGKWMILSTIMSPKPKPPQTRVPMCNISSPEAHWEVIVSNMGRVLETNDEITARRTFQDYINQSKLNVGRAGGESVELWCNNEPVSQFLGKHQEEEMEELGPCPHTIEPNQP